MDLQDFRPIIRRISLNGSVCLLIIFAYLSSTSLPLNGWHENMGISDQRATELYITNPENPVIKNWQEGLLETMVLFIRDCITDPTSPEAIDLVNCNVRVKTIYDNCLHHPGIQGDCNEYNGSLRSYINSYINEHPTVISGSGENSTYNVIQPKQLSTNRDYQAFSTCIVETFAKMREAIPC